MEKPQMWFCRVKCENSHPLVKVTDVSFFIYVVAYQPSSYTELLSRQRLTLKIIHVPKRTWISYRKVQILTPTKYG